MDVPGLFVDTREIFNWDQSSAALSKEWYVRMTATPQQTETVLQRMKQDLGQHARVSLVEHGGRPSGGR